jgi:acetyl-CoA carboxylase biotin carboxyl carrier protein
MSGSGDVFDVKKIRRLVQLMEEHGLTEVDLEQGEQRMRLRRHSEVNTAPAAPPAAVSAPAAAAPAAQPAPATASADAANIVAIKSPMVGTFYAAQNPESPAFVKVGDHVGKDTPVCIVEAMKVFNEIPAGTSGKIVAVLVENGEPVEYGQPLFKVDTSA